LIAWITIEHHHKKSDRHLLVDSDDIQRRTISNAVNSRPQHTSTTVASVITVAFRNHVPTG